MEAVLEKTPAFIKKCFNVFIMEKSVIDLDVINQKTFYRLQYYINEI